MAYAAQAQAKREWVQEALTHRTGFRGPLTIVSAEKEWAYRQKIVLHFQGDKALGYFARDNRTLLDISYCPIFDEERTLFSKVKEFLKGVESDGALAVLKSKNGFLLRFSFPRDIPGSLRKKTIESVAFSLENPREYITRGTLQEEVTVDGLKITMSPKVFIQNYPEQSLNIYRDVIAAATGDRVLDLYSGVGILSALLAKQGKAVTGIEINRDAVLLAEQNAHRNDLAHLRFICGPVEGKLTAEYGAFLTWIVNPPREGLSAAVLEKIIDFGPEKLIYISCNPMTLRRDVELLTHKQYRIEQAKAYDMFPQTTHVETVVSLTKK
jgi:23S rRNA (uracil1939-C5)-methyltransferase